MKRAKQKVKPEPSPRELIGLNGAHEGDLLALQHFLNFTRSECWSLGCAVPELPQCIRDRLIYIEGELRSVIDFIAGYEHATKPVKTESEG